MNENNENKEKRSLAPLLEQLRGAAVTAEAGAVREFNAAAAALLPALREGTPLEEREGGILLCGVELACRALPLEGVTIYLFAEGALRGPQDLGGLAENVAAAMIDALSPSFTAAELMAEDEDREEDDARRLAILRHNQYRLLHVAKNLQMLGRVGAGEHVADPALFDMDDLCGHAVHLADGVLRFRGAEAQFESLGVELLFYGDPRLLSQALLDLMANSAACCGEGCTLRLRLRKSMGKLRITLSDNGGGITGEGYSRILEPFRAHGGQGKPAAGLSIAAARAVIEQHGGSLTFESRPGEGTQVTILLPALKGDESDLYASAIHYEQDDTAAVLTAFSDVLDYKSYAPPYL